MFKKGEYVENENAWSRFIMQEEVVQRIQIVHRSFLFTGSDYKYANLPVFSADRTSNGDTIVSVSAGL